VELEVVVGLLMVQVQLEVLEQMVPLEIIKNIPNREVRINK
jgi:hypothetical protein